MASELPLISQDVLGAGAFGKVYRAKYGPLQCAAKLLHNTMFEGGDPGIRRFAERFEQECQFLRTVKHPNIVQYLKTFRDPQSNRLVLLMELMDENLTNFLERSPASLSYRIQLNICRDVALALSYLHSNAIIHRDLSSNNVLLIGEGSRAKVTDFGMSKLMDDLHKDVSQTFCPGTVVFMPPEALTRPPHYTNKLDCFSYGVLTIQIATRKFPYPSNATTTIEDARFPSGRIILFAPEIERRKSHIDLIEPDHPLLPIALQCLNNRDTERPSADSICEMLAAIEMDAQDADTSHFTAVRKLQEKLDNVLQSSQQAIEDLRRDKEMQAAAFQARLQQKDELLLKERTDYSNELKMKNNTIADLQLELRQKDQILSQVRADYTKDLEEKSLAFQQVLDSREHSKTKKYAGTRSSLKSTSAVTIATATRSGDPTWRREQANPGCTSKIVCGVAHGDIAYFTDGTLSMYSYSLPDSKWTQLPLCKYIDFGMAVVDGHLVTIGGYNFSLYTLRSETNVLLSLLPGKLHRMRWKEALPAMPTRRANVAAVTSLNHLIVAGGGIVVEVLDLATHQWFKAKSLPSPLAAPQMVAHAGLIYLSESSVVLSCSCEELFKTHKSYFSDSDSVWTKLAVIPNGQGSSLVANKDHVLVLGGKDKDLKPITAIRKYDSAINSWSVIGKLPVPLFGVVAVVMASNELVVVGDRNVHIGTDVV